MALAEAIASNVGHNLPPVEKPDPERLRLELRALYAEQFTRRDQLLTSARSWPDTIETEEQAKELSDLLKMFRTALALGEGTFKLEKAPWLEAGRVVDGVFTAGLVDPLTREGKRLRATELKYIDAKATKERLAREEAARLAREEADRLAREALAAENARLAVAKAQREAEEKAQREAEDRAAAEHRAAVAEAERVAKLTANPNSQEPPAPIVVAPPPPPPPPAPAPAPSPAPANNLLAQATAAAERANELERSALAKPAEMGRVRGDRGGVSTIRKIWTGEVADRTVLDLEALRGHFTQDALEAAVRAFVKANAGEGKPAPVLRGANIYQKNV